nr:MAG TPA: major capsid protein [Caudoviricetes sp.]
MDKKYDFAGWATRFGIPCSDGRTILKGAFKENNGATVPLVWNHNHTDADNVLGHALLEDRDSGVYAYCSFNDTPQGRNAKALVQHGDICALSIYANKLKQNGNDVVHGAIREVSLVLAGANPGAYIENVISHGESEPNEEEAYIWNSSEGLELSHADNDTKEEKQMAEEEKKIQAADETDDSEETIEDVINTMTDKQKKAMFAIVGQAIEDAKNGDAESAEEDNKDMKHNAFENQNKEEKKTEELSHAEFSEIVSDAKKYGSMKESFLEHGITNVENLFPEVQAVNKEPYFVSREMDWVKGVMSGVKHTPFSRIKSTYANITADAARAKGYIKGKQKVEEVIVALKRTTTPTTIYKLQAMDRDDVIDITDFDVVAWLKSEMRVMLDEELARAILIGDGRSASDNDHINTSNIRPILGDDPTYTVSRTLERVAEDTDDTFAKKFIHDVIKSRKEYKGSGNPVLYTSEDMLTNMLLMEDKTGRVIYDSVDKLATALRVSKIVTVPVFEGHTRTVGANNFALLGILVNLSDYNVGADKGGQVSMFDDFDIDFNKQKYLIETRCSGALVVPYSAISFEEKLAG